MVVRARRGGSEHRTTESPWSGCAHSRDAASSPVLTRGGGDQGFDDQNSRHFECSEIGIRSLWRRTIASQRTIQLVQWSSKGKLHQTMRSSLRYSSCWSSCCFQCIVAPPRFINPRAIDDDNLKRTGAFDIHYQRRMLLSVVHSVF